MTRERSMLVHFDLHFIVTGPKNEGDAEPWDDLINFQPAAGAVPYNLPEVGRASTKQENGDWLLVIHVEGLPPNQNGLVLMEIDHAGSEDPIESFQKFLGPNGLQKKWGFQLNSQTGQLEGWKPKVKDPDSGEMVNNPFYGTTHFLNDSAIFRVTFLSTKFDPSILMNICKIDQSLVPDAVKPYLAKQQNQDWLKRSVKGAYRGNVWEFTLEWLLGVWAPDIYSPLAAGTPLPAAGDPTELIA